MIKTKRCTIKRFAKEHVDFFNALVTDKRVRQYLGGVPSKRHIEQQINRYLNSAGDAFWIVQEDETGDFIGFISVNKASISSKDEISYEFLPSRWGKGYAIECITKIIEYIFNNANCNELIAITQTKNDRSKKLLERVGMQLVKTKVMFDEDQSIYHLKSNQFAPMLVKSL